MDGNGLLFRNVGPETKALGFSMLSISRLYGPVGQDDQLVIDKQGFWFRRRCKELPEYRAIEQFTRRKTKARLLSKLRGEGIENAALQ
jgi:hypothetical protein